jgi:hypothetical protein
MQMHSGWHRSGQDYLSLVALGAAGKVLVKKKFNGPVEDQGHRLKFDQRPDVRPRELRSAQAVSSTRHRITRQTATTKYAVPSPNVRMNPNQNAKIIIVIHPKL